MEVLLCLLINQQNNAEISKFPVTPTENLMNGVRRDCQFKDPTTTMVEQLLNVMVL